MARVLDLGPVFTDRSSAGKMRDSYPIAILRMKHVVALFVEGCASEAIYLSKKSVRKGEFYIFLISYFLFLISYFLF
jgi:hypothetical protein